MLLRSDLSDKLRHRSARPRPSSEPVASFRGLDVDGGIRWQQQPLGDEGFACRPDACDIGVAIAIPLLERGSRVVRRFALSFGAGEVAESPVAVAHLPGLGPLGI